MSEPVITAITTLIVALIGAISPMLVKWAERRWGKEPEGGKPPESTPVSVILFGGVIGGVIGALAGWLLIAPAVAPSGPAPTPAPAPALVINEPQPGDTVLFNVRVRGTWENVPEGQHLWIFVYPEEVLRYYPQSQNVVRFLANGEWSGRVFLGTTNVDDSGDVFDIAVGLADDVAHRELTTYIEQSEREGSYPGISELPEGLRLYVDVTVTRE